LNIMVREDDPVKVLDFGLARHPALHAESCSSQPSRSA
jgi:serine/threonine protein kinase